MRFIFADSLDMVDPGFDFLNDRYTPMRRPYWDDAYPHEILPRPPYDGMLVSRGIVGGPQRSGKYSQAQSMRFVRDGARTFLRLDTPELSAMPIFGDCGAFTYHADEKPPYEPEETTEFYANAGFTHGCSVDHIIFDFDETVSGMEGGSLPARARFDLTLHNAERFLSECKALGRPFEPLGVIQGWSPGSMAEAARRLSAMGYTYLALGGTVPLRAPQIKACLRAIREAVPHHTNLHILGFAKAGEVHEFDSFRITSFDTTSPLLRAFKDARANYYLRENSGPIQYFTAIRIPQALENAKFLRLVKRGHLSQDTLLEMERDALQMLRRYGRGTATLDETLETVMAYTEPGYAEGGPGGSKSPNALSRLEARYRETLAGRVWERCDCSLCATLGIEIVLFRASNRNKRRGIHNLHTYQALVQDLARAHEAA